MIHFISPLTAWSLQSGINMDLLSRIPDLDWMVMEGSRAFGYGHAPHRVEEEVQLQLRSLKQATGTNTGFGSYAMAHTYGYPLVTNGTTNATYNIAWMTQDMAYAVAPEFQSGILVPYSDAHLVNRPGYTSGYQNAYYQPEVAHAWSEKRFELLWSPLQGHSLSAVVSGEPGYQFGWEAVEQARSYDWQISISSNFTVTNQSLRTGRTNHVWSMLADPLPAGQPLYWRVRGVFHVYAYNDAGVVTGTNVYTGAWAPAPSPVVLSDSDSDGLYDIWEMYWFGDLDASAAADPDGDGLANAQEYAWGANPLQTDTDGDGLSDALEVFEYGTDPGRADTDGDGLNDHAEIITYGTPPLEADGDGDGLNDYQEIVVWGTDPADIDSDGDGLSDYWEVLMGLNPLTNDSSEDPDDDGLPNSVEFAHGTDPENPDSDGDGLSDSLEVLVHGTHPLLADTDGDGTEDRDEVEIFHTDPLNADTDGDGMPDGWEIHFGLDPGLDDAAGDIDDDGLTHLQEYEHGSNPLQADSDSDGLPDRWEVENGFHPASDGGRAHGLVARWAFDEGGGGVASNSVSTNWPGVLRYMVESNWTTGRGGGALWFDGLNDNVWVSQSAVAVVTSAPFTVTAVVWQDPGSTSAYPSIVSDGDLLSGDRWPGFLLRYVRNGDRMVAYAGNTNSPIGGIAATNWTPDRVGRWVDVALAHDGAVVRLYVDGCEVAAATNSFHAARRSELRIGVGHVNEAEAFWMGRIDDIRIFRSALDELALASVNDWIGDEDADGLPNGPEWECGTDPRDSDSDDDGLSDSDEVGSHGTDPLTPDTDADGMPDGWEVLTGLNARVSDADADVDGDGLTNVQEYEYGTNPQDPDPDGDSLNDYAEAVTHGTDPFDADSDDDGLNDYAEAVTHGTNPLDADSDSDGLSDPWELAVGLNPLSGTASDGGSGDPDADGCANLQEMEAGTNPLEADTDADGLDDGDEFTAGTDPLNLDSDRDGLPDGWETQYAFDPLSHGGTNRFLMARWTFDGDGGDLVSNRLFTSWPGRVRNVATTNWIAGRGAGRALWFNGSNSYVAVTQSVAIVTSAPFTVTAVVWQEGTWTGKYPSVVSDGGLLTGYRWPGYLLRYEQAVDGLLGYAGNTNTAGGVVAATNWLAAGGGRWVDVALSHDGTVARLYVDGREVSASTNSFEAQRRPELWIGRGHVNELESYWRGAIDDVRIYRSALDTNALVAVNDWLGDPDGDGYINGAEYERGTDPRNP